MITRSERTRRSPASEPPRTRASSTLGRATLARRISRIGLTLLPLTLGGTAVAAAAMVRTWPAVIAMAVVLLMTLVWVGLGPTLIVAEDGRIVYQCQLSFARRAPLRPLADVPEPTNASLLARRPQITLAIDPPSPTTATIRAWARDQGFQVHDSGPLPHAVRDAWEHREA